ncbi:succinate dehydrogenase subunit C [mine drainage metagenome]|uniref:Succinate dehydrogenase subunit C n=2 Tax=mine drainage metagenome TaxID=410659 RepID=T1BII4_9ZZZZ
MIDRADGRGPSDGVPAYYPGCSMDGLGKAYEVSCQLVLDRLGLTMDRIVDYNCCGATEVKNLSQDVSLALPARNLAMARSMGRHEVIAACNGCVYSLTRANDAIADELTRTRINSHLEKGGSPAYDGEANVQHVLEFIHNRAGVERIRTMVRRPLEGLKVAPYYGCLYSRPKRYTGVGTTPGTDNPEHPFFLDELLGACGATVLREYPAKTICCGGGHALSDLDVSVAFSASVMNEAKRVGADLVATICPLGQINIENNLDRIRQAYGEEVLVPVTYFTQLMALALGASVREARLKDNFSRPDRFLRARGFP